MFKLLPSLFLLLVLSKPQISDPVKWKFSSIKVSDNEYELIFTATIEDKWAIYSQHIEDGGPEPTFFEFKNNENYELVGVVNESKLNRVAKKDPFFLNAVVTKFYKKAVFKQKIRLKNSNKSAVKGELMFMACNSQFCLPPTDVAFQFNVSN